MRVCSWPSVLSRLLFISGVPVLLFAVDYYKLEGVRRVDQDLYKARDGLFIETKYCYHYTYGEDAVLKWEGPYSYNNTIIWDDDSSCGVKRVFR